ncbi:MAG: hypothetical protein WCJ09_11265 [Planctomycetota bacterium]
MDDKPVRTFVLLKEDDGTTVLVVPKDRDQFCVEIEEAIKACRMVDAGYTFVTQAYDLQEHLAKWIAARRETIQAAYLTLRAHGRLLFVVVQSDVRRNAALADAITDLDIEIASDDRFNNLRVDVQTLPRSSTEALTAFLSSGNDVVEYANKDSAREGSESQPVGPEVLSGAS